MKYKKGIVMLLVMAALAVGLTGCAENQIPDMTEEEMRDMGEFVAFTLMKYDAGHRSRLMDLPPVEEEYPSNSHPVQIPDSKTETGMDPVDDTPVVDNAEQQTEAGSYSAEETMGLPEGVTFSFVGQKLYDSYPEGEGFFAVTAREGKKLLVLSFALENTQEQDVQIDMLSSGTACRISVNGERYKRAFSTMLTNDLTFFRETLSAGESKEAVLVVEVSEDVAESISSISLELKNESKSCIISLVQE